MIILIFFSGQFWKLVPEEAGTFTHVLCTTYLCFIHLIFRFWFLVSFGYEVMKILRNLCLHFARQDGQDGKNPERKSHNLSDQNTKNKKTKIWAE